MAKRGNLASVAVRGEPQYIDQVARWETLRFIYPEASYATEGPWFYGSLRDVDDIIKASSLERMIDRLVAREPQEGQ
jgi:hypothetical protein